MSSSVTSMLQALQGALGRSGQEFLVQSDQSFNKTLNLGQIIKGKVLRHYEGGRYTVEFSGQEKVVDSAVPLKTGEILYGRVVGLGDTVRIQRVYPDQGVGLPPISPDANVSQHTRLSAKERLLVELYNKYQTKLSAEDRAIVLGVLNRSSNPALMALSSLIVSKIGVSQKPEFLRAIFRNLDINHVNSEIQKNQILRLAVDHNNTLKQSTDPIAELAGMLQSFSQRGKYSGALQYDTEIIEPANNAEERVNLAESKKSLDEELTKDNGYKEWLLGRWLLNAQSDGSVSHRLMSFPLWLGGQLVDVDVAMFNQREFGASQFKLQHKRLVFSLDIEYLGHIELTVSAANKNLRVELTADNEFAAEYMSGYLGELKSLLTEYDWKVEEITYSVAHESANTVVTRAIAEHYVTQDSLNQLI